MGQEAVWPPHDHRRVGGLASDPFKDFETGAISDPVPDSIRTVAARRDRGEFDLVAVGRSLLADPNWEAKVQ